MPFYFSNVSWPNGKATGNFVKSSNIFSVSTRMGDLEFLHDFIFILQDFVTFLVGFLEILQGNCKFL